MFDSTSAVWVNQPVEGLLRGVERQYQTFYTPIPSADDAYRDHLQRGYSVPNAGGLAVVGAVRVSAPNEVVAEEFLEILHGRNLNPLRRVFAFLEVTMLTALFITLAAICPAFGVPISGAGYDLPALNEYTLTVDGIDALLHLDASHKTLDRLCGGRLRYAGRCVGRAASDPDHNGGERSFDVLYSEATPGGSITRCRFQYDRLRRQRRRTLRRTSVRRFL